MVGGAFFIRWRGEYFEQSEQGKGDQNLEVTLDSSVRDSLQAIGRLGYLEAIRRF